MEGELCVAVLCLCVSLPLPNCIIIFSCLVGKKATIVQGVVGDGTGISLLILLVNGQVLQSILVLLVDNFLNKRK